MRELAAHACVGVSVAWYMVPAMAKHGALEIVRTRRVPYRNRPVAEYAIPLPVEQNQASGGWALGAAFAVSAITSGKACGIRAADIVPLAAAHLACATGLYVARLQEAATRDVGIENSGAISEVGTDIGAGIVEGLKLQAQLNAAAYNRTEYSKNETLNNG